MSVTTPTRLSQPSPKVVSRAGSVGAVFTSGEIQGICCGRGGGVRGSGGGFRSPGGAPAAGSGSGAVAGGAAGASPTAASIHSKRCSSSFWRWARSSWRRTRRPKAPEMASIRSRSGLTGSSGADIPFQTTLRINPMSDSGFPLPPPTFEFLVFSLKTQAEMQLGLFQFGEASEEPPNLPAARHAIDLLAMIVEKTHGNLSIEEQRLIENSLTELRFRF